MVSHDDDCLFVIPGALSTRVDLRAQPPEVDPEQIHAATTIGDAAISLYRSPDVSSSCTDEAGSCGEWRVRLTEPHLSFEASFDSKPTAQRGLRHLMAQQILDIACCREPFVTIFHAYFLNPTTGQCGPEAAVVYLTDDHQFLWYFATSFGDIQVCTDLAAALARFRGFALAHARAAEALEAAPHGRLAAALARQIAARAAASVPGTDVLDALAVPSVRAHHVISGAADVLGLPAEAFAVEPDVMSAAMRNEIAPDGRESDGGGSEA